MNYQKMKDELWRAFFNNLPIKVNVIENGRMVVKEISPDSADYADMYTKQSAYLNDKIHSSSVDSIMDEIRNNNSESFNSEVDRIMGDVYGDSSVDGSKTVDQDLKQSSKKTSLNKKVAIVKKGDTVYVIGDITEEELKKGNNSIFESASKLGNKIIICNTADCNKGVNYSTKSGISFTIGSEGNISIFGDFDKVQYFDSKPLSNEFSLDVILKNASMGHKIVISSLLTKYGIDKVWDEVLLRLDSKKMSLEDFNKFVIDLKSLYSVSEIKHFNIFNSNYKKIIDKYSIEDEVFVSLQSILGYARNGFKKGMIAVISKYGIDNIWMDIADSLNSGKISKKEYENFVNNLKKMFSKEECDKYQIFSSNHYKALQDGKILYEDGSQKINILTKDEMGHKTVPSKARDAKSKHSQKVKNRRDASDSLKNKFLTKVNSAKEWWSGLSPRTKGIIAVSTIAVVGIGIIVLNASTIKDVLENVNSTINLSSMNSAVSPVNHITQQIHSSIGNIQDTISNIQNAGVNWDAIGEGHIGYRTAADAISGTNGVTLSSFFGKEPSSNIIDVYNTVTGWMHLTKEQLNDPELLKELSQDPNNAIHIKDAWFNLSDVVSELIKGGRVL